MSQRKKRSLSARPANHSLPATDACFDEAYQPETPTPQTPSHWRMILELERTRRTTIISGSPDIELPSHDEPSEPRIHPFDKSQDDFPSQTAEIDKCLRELDKHARREFAIRATMWLLAAQLFLFAGQWVLTVTAELRAANSHFQWLPLVIYSGFLAATLWGLLLGKSTKRLVLKISYVALVLLLLLTLLASNGFIWWEVIRFALGVSQANLPLMCLACCGSFLAYYLLCGVIGDGHLLDSILGINRMQNSRLRDV